MIARRLALLPAILFALAGGALVGCGDDEPASSTSAESETTRSTASSNSTTSSESISTTEDGETPPAERTVTKPTPFGSPTGNIGCFIDRASVRCDIANRDWQPPEPPRRCKLDYGQGITIDAGGPPEFVCAGDTTLGAGQPVPYGGSITSGLLRCESEESGMTCLDIETGRGFSISQQGYELL